MGRNATRTAVVLPALLLAAGLLPFAAGHGAGTPPGYDQLLHDCNDDYGGDTPLSGRSHDLIALYVKEADVDGTPMLILQLAMARQGLADSTPVRETIAFETPRLNVSTTLQSDKERNIAHVDGLQPAHIKEGLPVYNTDGSTDSNRAAYEIGYTYDQLQVQTDEELTGFHATGLYGSNGWTQGDHLAGGRYTNGQYQAGCETNPSAPFFKLDTYTIRASDWTVGGDGSDDGGDGGEDPTGTPLTADFTFAPKNPATAEDVTFTDTSSGAPTSWSWDLGDGTTSQEQNPVHAYPDDGTYRVRLTVSDAEGAEATVTKNILVLNRRPVADFTWSPEAIHVDAPIAFQSTAHDPDGEIVSTQWDFGDDQTATGDNVTHTFRATGSRTVTLTVTDEEGALHTVRKTLDVHEAGPGDEAIPAPHMLITLTFLTLALAVLRRR